MAVKETSQTLGSLLTQARKGRGDSLRGAGATLGVSDTMVRQWEADFAKPEWYRASAIADYCGASRARVLHLMGVITQEEAGRLESDAGGYHAAAA